MNSSVVVLVFVVVVVLVAVAVGFINAGSLQPGLKLRRILSSIPARQCPENVNVAVFVNVRILWLPAHIVIAPQTQRA